MYTTTELTAIVAEAKCCFGVMTCRMLRKAMNAEIYQFVKYVNIELYLNHFALETHLVHDCLDDEEIETIVHKIKKVCHCQSCSDSYSSGSSSSTGVHTSSDHTSLDHTE